MKTIENNLRDLKAQKNNVYSLLESKVYDLETFNARLAYLNARILETENLLAVAHMRSAQLNDPVGDTAPVEIHSLLDIYLYGQNPEKKNRFLKSILSHCVYFKEKHHRDDEFILTLYPKLPNARE
jgi:hypothetical protein